ncbi:Dynamin [Penicillium angulare]|uniref:Dynamin n=1 Tax=Penicillium angulare TaxID=116970 RepID=A0A9W9FIN3_9EURO|nr:Dynamin [Penicillium angulare]
MPWERKVKMKTDENEEDQNEEQLVTEKAMFKWIKERLFHIQSCRWKQISQAHIGSVVSLVTQFVRRALKFVVKDAGVHGKLQKHIMATFDENTDDTHEGLVKLIQDERGHPITYNHYYTDNIQKARHDEAKDSIRNSVKKAA